MRGHRKGSALIFVLLIIMLIGGMMANLTTVIYINILRNRKYEYQFQARQNAIFALHSAIAQLQRMTGPDNRITVPNKHSPRKIEVWKVDENVNKLTFVGHLGSSSFDDKQGNTVKNLFPYYSDEISPIPIKDGATTIGKFGFTTADESQKIKVTLVDFYAKSNSQTAKQVRYLCPQAFALNDSTGRTLSENFLASKLDFPEQLAYINDDFYKKFRENAQLFTCHSYGVLSNPIDGGLKADLRQFIQKSSGMKLKIFENDFDDSMTYVPQWSQISSFLNIWEDFDGYEFKVSASNPMFRPQFLQNYTGQSSDLQTPKNHGVYPVIVQGNLDIGIGVTNGHLAITYTPNVVLWNPYNVTLGMADYCIELCIPSETFNYKPCIKVLARNSENTDFVDIGTFPVGSSRTELFLSNVVKLRFSAKFSPGEVKAFSPTDTALLDHLSGNTATNYENYSNFLYVDTGIDASKYSSVKLCCTNSLGQIGLNWNCFYWRLFSPINGEIYQEIAELDPDVHSSDMVCERNLSNDNSLFSKFSSRLPSCSSRVKIRASMR